MTRMTISTTDLRSWSDVVFEAIEASGVTDFEFAESWYWQLNSEEIRRPQPPTPTVGDLSVDVADIRNDVARAVEERSAYAWHTLDHLIGVLTRVSAELKGTKFAVPERGNL